VTGIDAQSAGREVWRERGLASAPPDLRARFRSEGRWGDHCLLDWWDLAVRACPDACAVVDRSGVRFTYAEADEASSRLAAWMRGKGIDPGETVALQLPNWAEFLPFLVAAAKLGAVVNPLSPNLRRTELAHAIASCRTRLAVMPARHRDTDFRPLADGLLSDGDSLETALLVPERADGEPGARALQAGLPAEDGRSRQPDRFGGRSRIERLLESLPPLPRSRWVRSSGDDVAAVLFTSGSEAQAKGVMLTHNNLIASESAFAQSLGIGPGDRMLMPAPLGHATGFMHGVVMPMLTRTTSILCDAPRPRAMAELVARHGATCGMSVPSVIDALLCACEGDRERLATVRLLCCGGSPVPRRLMERARRLGVRLHSVYGSTESAPHTMTTVLDSDERVLTTDGRACPGTEIRIVDPATHRTLPPGVEGEEASRGPAVFSGYLGQPDLTARVLDEDGWYYSGDLAVADEEGYIRITGRMKDLIIRGGENISPSEVERALMDHPSIAAAAAIAIPDDVMGQRVYAYLVARDGAAPLDVADLQEWFVARGMAKFKIPEFVEYLDEMPLTSSGKTDKVTLRRRLRASHPERWDDAASLPQNAG
jgi:AMP-dependent synthetase/ligase